MKGRRHTTVRTDLQMCYILHVLIHIYIFVWYNGSLQLFLLFLVPTHVMPNANEITHYLENFLTSTGTWLRPFHNDVRIFLILWFTEHGQLLTQRCNRHELHGYLRPPNLGTLLVEIHGQTCGCSLFCSVCWGPSRDVNLFRLNFFQESFNLVDLGSSTDSFIGI